MTPEDLNRHSLLNCDVEVNAPSDPAEQLPYYVDQRIEALVEKDWDRYNLCGRRIVNLIDDRKRGTL